MPRFLLVIVFLLIHRLSVGQISAYRVFFGTTVQKPQQLILRQWQQNRQTYYLTVDPQTLQTSVVGLPPTAVQAIPWSTLAHQFQQTPYLKAMAVEGYRDTDLQDAGLERADTTERGFSLTIDLCPSNKPLTRSVFSQLIAAFEQEEKPIPVTITITGLWMAHHAEDLAYLKSLVRHGDLDITWVNHSYYHHYDPRLPLAINFLLEPNTNLSNEVLLTEQAMLKNGLLPSVFFRFPGLVSNKTVFDRILAFGLLPIGSDAWLAKNQQPKQGSLVLIHANGNEPMGITDFIKLIQQKAVSIRNKTWLLYQLPTSIADTIGK